MSIKISSGLRDFLLISGNLHTALSGCTLKIYGSPTSQADADALVPSAADGVVEGSLLCTIKQDDGVLTLNDYVLNGAIQKSNSVIWLGDIVTSGYASYYRLSPLEDDGAASTTEVRVQGTVGTMGTDMVLSSTDLISGQEQRLDTYIVGLPLA